MRGRKPKTAGQHLAEGDPSHFGRKKLLERQAAEPKPVRGLPPCPSHLKGMARKAWLFLAPQIELMEQDYKPDALMLEGACVNYARAVQADQIVDREGLTVEESRIDDETGEKTVLRVKTRPEVHISNQAWLRVRAFCSEFGISPVSRTRLAMEKGASHEAENIAEILSRPRTPRVPPPVVQ